MKFLEPARSLGLREGDEVVIEVQEDIVQFARHIRSRAKPSEEPSIVLSKERERFG